MYCTWFNITQTVVLYLWPQFVVDRVQESGHGVFLLVQTYQGYYIGEISRHTTRWYDKVGNVSIIYKYETKAEGLTENVFAEFAIKRVHHSSINI